MTQDMIVMAAIDSQIEEAFRMGFSDDEVDPEIPSELATSDERILAANPTLRLAHTLEKRGELETGRKSCERTLANLQHRERKAGLPVTATRSFKGLDLVALKALESEMLTKLRVFSAAEAEAKLAAERDAQAKLDARKASEKRYVDLLNEGNSLAGKHGKSERKPIRELSKLTDEALAAATKELEEGVSRLRSLEARATHKRDQELLRDYNHARLTGKTRLPRALWIEQQLNPGRYYGRTG